MKTFIRASLLATVSVFAMVAQAGDLIGYSQSIQNNQYQVINTDGKVLYQNIADSVKNVSLRNGYGIIQDQFNFVTVVKEDGTKVVDGFYGSIFRGSKNLVGIYTPNGNGGVYREDQTKVYSSIGVKSLSVSENYFGVIDQYSAKFELYNAAGTKLWMQILTESAQMSDSFVALYSTTGEFTLKTVANVTLAMDQTILSSAVSDQFAAFIGSDGWLKVYSASNGNSPVFTNAQVKNYGVFNKYFYVEDQLGTVIYDVNGTPIFSLGFNTPYWAAEHAVTFKLNTGGLIIVSELGDTFSTNMVDTFVLNANFLATKTGPGLNQVYQLNKTGFGKPASSELSSLQDSTVKSVVLGISAIGLQYQAQSRAEVRVGSKTVLSKTFVNRLDLSGEEFRTNWARF